MNCYTRKWKKESSNVLTVASKDVCDWSIYRECGVFVPLTAFCRCWRRVIQLPLDTSDEWLTFNMGEILINGDIFDFPEARTPKHTALNMLTSRNDNLTAVAHDTSTPGNWRCSAELVTQFHHLEIYTRCNKFLQNLPYSYLAVLTCLFLHSVLCCRWVDVLVNHIVPVVTGTVSTS